MNQFIIMGHLGQDPESKSFSSGQTVTNFSVATSKKWKSKDGESQEKTQWHNCQAWGKTGEIIQKYFTKGKPILVHGEIDYQTWDKDDGSKGYATKIIVNSFEFLPSGKAIAATGDSDQPARPDVPNEAPSFDSSEDMPAF